MEDVITIIKKNGYKFIPTNFLNINIDELSKDFEKIYNRDIKKSNRDNVVEINYTKLKNYNFINSIYKLLIKKIFNNKLQNYALDKIWLVKSNYKTADPNKLPHIPHIDKHRYFKIMIYIDKIESTNGPFMAINSKPDHYEKTRLNLKDDYKKYQNNVINIDKSKFFSCLGEKGSIVIFDTNCPHYAEIFNDKISSRRVIRFDFDKKENFYKNILNSLKINF